jgi:hypothetical protein
MDRFIAGEPIAARDLRPVWRDFFGWGFDAPIYEQFFRTVRGINRTLPSAQRLRVCLGDPPVDWTQITRQADIFPWLEQRDAHYAAVIETAILAPGYHGLLDLIGNKSVDVCSRYSLLVRRLHLADSRSAGCADRRRFQS